MNKDETIFIKPNRHVHDSGYRCFTTIIGKFNPKTLKVEESRELGTYSDHIDIDLHGSSFNRVNLDMTKDGYIRPFINEKGKRLVWMNEEFSVSSATILVKEET